MLDQIQRLCLASRILLASVAYDRPDNGDVAELFDLAESDAERKMAVDELAREVMNREVRRCRGQQSSPAKSLENDDR